MKVALRFRRSLPILVLGFVLGFALVYALAWIQLYLQPHPYVVTSEWIFDNVPKGSVIAASHWDDKLPLSLPGKDGVPGKEAPKYYVMEGKDIELPFYERDTREKLNIVLRKVAKADYIVFPTPRVVDSIPRIPEEYPYTTAFLQLLWAEKIGFSFVKSVKDRPSFLGITFNDDLADESFAVYDHPKAVVFKNVERLSEEQMRERVLNADRYQPLPSLNEMLLMDEGGWAATATMPDPRLRWILQAFVVVLALAFSFWVLIGSRLSFLPDRGLGASLLGGIVCSAGLTCLLAVLGVLPFTPASSVFVAGAIIVIGLVRFVSSVEARRRFSAVLGQHRLFALVALVAGLSVVVAMRSLFPEYFWSVGDVEMYALSFFTRNTTFPADAGWSSGVGSAGGYIGHLLAGWLAKVVGASGTFVHELSFSILGAMVGGILYTGVSLVVRRPLYALLATAVALVPAIRGVHVIFNGHVGIDTAQAQAMLDPNHKRLVDFLSTGIKGAPLVSEACDAGSTHSKAAIQAGLPTFKAQAGSVGDPEQLRRREEAATTICSLQDPEAAFQAMMKYGVSLLIVPRGSGEGSVARQETLARFANRRDLFAPIYIDGETVVLATAFSDSFPRAYNQPAPIE